jgi:hypothetical protein
MEEFCVLNAKSEIWGRFSKGHELLKKVTNANSCHFLRRRSDLSRTLMEYVVTSKKRRRVGVIIVYYKRNVWY